MLMAADVIPAQKQLRQVDAGAAAHPSAAHVLSKKSLLPELAAVCTAHVLQGP